MPTVGHDLELELELAVAFRTGAVPSWFGGSHA
jgi:hypothetical protein